MQQVVFLTDETLEMDQLETKFQIFGIWSKSRNWVYGVQTFSAFHFLPALIITLQLIMINF